MKKILNIALLIVTYSCFGGEIKRTLAIKTVEFTGSLLGKLLQFGPAQLITSDGSTIVGTVKSTLFSNASLFVFQEDDHIRSVVKIPKNIFNTLIRFPDTFIGNHPYASGATIGGLILLFTWRYYNAKKVSESMKVFNSKNKQSINDAGNYVSNTVENFREIQQEVLSDIANAAHSAGEKITDNLKTGVEKFRESTAQYIQEFDNVSNSIIDSSKQETERQANLNDSTEKTFTVINHNLLDNIEEVQKQSNAIVNSQQELVAIQNQTKDTIKILTNSQEQMEKDFNDLQNSVNASAKQIEELSDAAVTLKEQINQTGQVTDSIATKMDVGNERLEQVDSDLDENTRLLKQLAEKK